MTTEGLTVTAHAIQHPDEPDRERRIWVSTASAMGGIAVVGTAIPFVASFEPSARAKAEGAPVEVDMATIQPGQMRIVEWRGKPVWLVRRTPAMLAALKGHDAELADPMSKRDQQPDDARNPTRSIKPEFFVAVGICTHLGCSPIAVPAGSDNPGVGADWPGGYLCPCHGSTFDGAGRVFKDKPAPSNLEIPPYRYTSVTRIVVGDDVG
jgi:ubiquinol-cytochrome c reductase iron-sulfur subunit